MSKEWPNPETGILSSSGELIHVGDIAGQQMFLNWVEGPVYHDPKMKLFFIRFRYGGYSIREGGAKLVKKFEPDWVKDIL